LSPGSGEAGWRGSGWCCARWPTPTTTSWATTAAFLDLTRRDGPGFRRLFHAAWPQSALDRVNSRRIAAGLQPFDPTVVYEPRGVPDEHIACTIDQREVVAVIREAFRAHRSQWSSYWSTMDDQAWVSSAGESHLVQAWPARDRRAPTLRDPLEGL